MKKWLFILGGMLLVVVGSMWALRRTNLNRTREIGEVVDRFNGVEVYYNGGVDHVGGRNVAPNGYNLGLRYQCVEFVKRYYFEHLHHQMPNAYGHAKDFFDPSVPDGGLNRQRNLLQFHNPSVSLPKTDDLLVFDGHVGNPFGHVAIVTEVTAKEVHLVQQNPGPFSPSRVSLPLVRQGKRWQIGEGRILGWLRLRNQKHP